MQRRPLISIIIPVYNMELYLDQCLNSIVNQTYSELEIILVNDGSTDNSLNIMKKYALEDKRFIIINQDNSGLSAARNIGIDSSHGEYVGFVDSDDWVESDMFECLLKALLENGADISCCGRYIVKDNYSVKSFYLSKPYVFKNHEEAHKELLKESIIDSAMWDKLFKRELFNDIQMPVGEIYEDIAIIYKLFFKADKIVHIGQSEYYYRKRNNSITSLSLSQKNMVLINRSQAIFQFTEEHFPSVIPFAEAYYYKCIKSLKAKLMLCKSNGLVDTNITTNIENLFKEAFPKALRCSELSKRDKVLMLLMHIKLYPIIYRLKRTGMSNR